MERKINEDWLEEALVGQPRGIRGLIFVCTGNYNRSPALAALTRNAFRKIPGLENLSVESRGVKEWSGMGGRSVSPFLITELTGCARREALKMRPTLLTGEEAVDWTKIILTVSERVREQIIATHKTAPGRCVNIPGRLWSDSTLNEELYDPQAAVQKALHSQEIPVVQNAREATQRMIDNLDEIVHRGIVPSICRKRGIRIPEGYNRHDLRDRFFDAYDHWLGYVKY